ncbi:uncharacterized protein TRIADDRAFT_52259 [Trichoplax adhaerens]|uniref:EamA domain-containing protein n=1 Tax=Trichoplax adhaerens TaxID=10228 RepID=B3RM73_TRIAD|nr:predicted protein [Trichoplax adhaerens]EDV28913.1 predicted protein [Trichoplax adhaerens]|eukprot:XP_002108115.1 predicted protein [Trichoplax adhaerens]
MVVINQNNPDAHESRSLIGANRNSQYGTTENGQPSTLDSNSTIGTAGYSTAEDDCFLIAGNTNDLSSKSYRTANEDEAIPNPTEAQVEDQNSSKSVIVGVILVVVYAICLSAATQTGKELYTTSNFTGASLVAWRASKFYMQKGSSLRITIIKIIPLTCLSLGIAYFYLISLSFLSSTNVSAIYSFSAAIVYVMSLIFLKEPFLFLRFLAVVISLAGVVLITIAKEDGSFIVSGVFLALAAAFCGASFRNKTICHRSFINEALFH